MEAADGFNRNGLADDQFGDLYKFPRNLGYRLIEDFNSRFHKSNLAFGVWPVAL